MEESPVVFVIDDDAGVRDSLRMTLEAAALRADGFRSAEDFLIAHPKGAAGCVVLDLRLGGMSGLELLRHLRSLNIDTPVIMITGHGGVPAAVETMKLGAIDFLEKPVDPNELVSKVQAAIRQSQQKQAKAGEIVDARSRFTDVTPRELEVLRLLAKGKSSKQIAGDLQISASTVDNHRAHMLAKTGAENIANLILIAMLAGLV